MIVVQLSIEQAKADLPKLIDDVLQGARVTISIDGVPLVRLLPIAPPGKRRFGALKGKIAVDARFDEPLSDSELKAWHQV